jgi:hypothetical protein
MIFLSVVHILLCFYILMVFLIFNLVPRASALIARQKPWDNPTAFGSERDLIGQCEHNESTES